MTIEQIDETIRRLKELKKSILSSQVEEKKQRRQKMLEWQKGLTTARVKCGFSLEEIALVAGVKKQSVYKWEHGFMVITPDKAKQLSLVLNYPL